MTLSCLTAFYILAISNRTFWSHAFGYMAGDRVAFVFFALGITALVIAILTAMTVKYLTKPILMACILISSTASWFNDQFGVIIDRDMIRNVAATTGAESAHLVTLSFVLHILLTGFVPSLFIVWVQVLHRPFAKKVLWNSAVIFPCLAVTVISGLAFSRTYAAVGRTHRDLMFTINPFMPIASAILYGVESEKDADIVAQPLGTDARRQSAGTGGKPRVLVIVVGETARAQDFSLGGYARNTNPELERQDVVYYRNVTSCGTATAVSLPCMFSVYPRKSYTHRKGLETENLLDVLSHAQIPVTWRDNDTGSYRITARVPYEFLPSSGDQRFCRDGECLDTILLDRLDDWLDHVTTDSVLVLHQLGSHGPAYFQRYSDTFRKFGPDCHTEELGKCSRDEIVNGYDNTIVFTDHVVSTAIDRLRQRSGKLATALVYMSDHGESLGENGLYLHGAPYIVAPEQQTHIPLLLWTANDFRAATGLDQACLKSHVDDAYSHDNLFHTVLGLMNVSTKVYDPSLDMTATCRRATIANANAG